MNNDEKLITPEVKKTWNNPEMTLISIQSGNVTGGAEGITTYWHTDLYNGAS